MHKNINANYKQKKLPKELITIRDFSECAKIRKKAYQNQNSNILSKCILMNLKKQTVAS